jgi:hypothetical protein
VFESREDRKRVEAWVNAQEKCPTRKEVKKQFPAVAMKHIRSALQARVDRDRMGA